MTLSAIDHDDPTVDARFALARERYAEADARRSAELAAAWRAENGRCRYCGAPLTKGNATGACGFRTSPACRNRARRDARKGGGPLTLTHRHDNVPSTSARGILPARQERAA